jgi:hypothetical protein
LGFGALAVLALRCSRRSFCVFSMRCRRAAVSCSMASSCASSLVRWVFFFFEDDEDEDGPAAAVAALPAGDLVSVSAANGSYSPRPIPREMRVSFALPAPVVREGVDGEEFFDDDDEEEEDEDEEDEDEDEELHPKKSKKPPVLRGELGDFLVLRIRVDAANFSFSLWCAWLFGPWMFGPEAAATFWMPPDDLAAGADDFARGDDGFVVEYDDFDDEDEDEDEGAGAAGDGDLLLFVWLRLASFWEGAIAAALRCCCCCLEWLDWDGDGGALSTTSFQSLLRVLCCFSLAVLLLAGAASHSLTFFEGASSHSLCGFFFPPPAGASSHSEYCLDLALDGAPSSHSLAACCLVFPPPAGASSHALCCVDLALHDALL